jgi:2-methylcitrate dehydratase PrpD
MTDADFPKRFEARIHVTFADAETKQVYVDDVFGGSRRPASREAVLNKFRTNTGFLGGEREVRALEDAVLSREDFPIIELTRALRALRCTALADAAE